MPLIDLDLRDLRAADGRRHRDAVDAIGRAGRSNGALALVGHGVPEALIARTFEVARAFFALPMEHKLRHAATRDNFRGFQPLPEGAGDLREKFLVTSTLGNRDAAIPSMLPGENHWPDAVPGFRDAVEACQRELEALARRVLCGISESLGLPPEAIAADCDPPGGSCLWLLHYPAVAPVQGRPGQGTSSHTDLSPLAIIVQDDVGGLEVRGDEGWEPVDARHQPWVCQMGDMVGRWSNGVFKPNVHRVCSPTDRSRYSLALFVQPAFDVVISPAATCVGPDRPPRHAPMTFGECLGEWLRVMDEGRGGYVPDP